MKKIINAYSENLHKILSLSYVDKCEMLLTIKELGLDYPKIEDCLKMIESDYSNYRINDDKIYLLLLGQMVFFKFDFSIKNRQAFLNYWVEEENFRKSELDIITITWILEIAAENIGLISEKSKNYIKKSLIQKVDKIDSLVSKSWFSYYLEKNGNYELSKKNYQYLINKKHSNGSWNGNLSITVRILYALSYSKCFNRLDFEDSIVFVNNRIKKGIELPLPLNAQIVKTFKRFNFITVYDNQYILNFLTQKNCSSVQKMESLIESDKIIEVIDVSKELIKNPFEKDFALLRSNYMEIESLYLKGVVTVELFLIEKRKIKNSLLEYIEKIKYAN